MWIIPGQCFMLKTSWIQVWWHSIATHVSKFTCVSMGCRQSVFLMLIGEDLFWFLLKCIF